jgi:hypothetical protein
MNSFHICVLSKDGDSSVASVFATDDGRPFVCVVLLRVQVGRRTDSITTEEFGE